MKKKLTKKLRNKNESACCFNYPLKKFTKAVLTSLVLSSTLWVTAPVIAQSVNIVETVKLPNAEYVQSSVDMQVKVLGGSIALERYWGNGKWYLNPTWANLRLISDSLDESIKTVDRAGTLFARTGDTDLYEANYSYIRKNQEGWRWYDRDGNWATYDAAGRITAYGNANNIRVDFILDEEGRRTGVRDHHGNAVYTFVYDQAERLTGATDSFGRTVQYHWSGDLLEKVTDVLGHEWQYKYDSNGQLIERIEPDGGSIKVAYAYSTPAPKPAMSSGKNAGQIESGSVVTTNYADAEAKIARVGRMTGKTGAVTLWHSDYDRAKKQYSINVEDANGKQSSVVYDAYGRRLSASVNGELQERVERDGSFQTKTWNARGIATTVQYDHSHRPIKTIHADGTVESYEYDETLNKPVRYTNPQGTVTAMEYNSQGDITKLVLAQGLPEQRIASWTYDTLGQPIQITYGDGQDQITLTQSYDEDGNVNSITDANGNTYQYIYNKLGMMTSVTNPLGNVWTMEYNDAGYPVSSTDPLNLTVHYTTDALGRITQVKDALGRTFKFAYEFNNEGWKVTQTNALEQSTVYQYDTVGNLVSMMSPSGLQVGLEYDDRGRVQEQIDPTQNTTKLEYGVLGSGLEGLVASTLYPTYQANYKYNAMGLPTQVIQVLGEANTLTTQLSYNELGALVNVIDPAGRSMQIKYDALGNRIGFKDFAGEETRQTWDIFGNLTSVTDANGNTHQFEYDQNGNLVKEVRPGGEIFTNAYDSANQLITQTDAEGKVAQYEYDAAGRLTQMLFTPANASQPSDIIQYVYNDANELIEIDQTGTTNTKHVYTLDDLGRKTSESITYSVGSNVFTKTLQYVYDEDGRLAEIVYPDSSKQTYAYENGLLKSVQLPSGEQVSWNGYQWVAPTEIVTPGGKQTLTYDALLRTEGIQVKSAANDVLMNYQYTYNNAGNIIERATEGGTYAYGYDITGRLTQATPPENMQQSGLPIESYSYDAVGNRLGSTEQPGQWLYNSNNQLIQYGEGANLTVMTYTPNGHVATQTRNGIAETYYYDALDRLVRITNKLAGNEIEIASYTYDPFGRRISKTVNNQTTYYLYTDEGLLAELDENGNMQKAYGWMPDSTWGTAPIWQAEMTTNQLQTAQYHFLYLDHLGAPQVAVNAQGQVTWKGTSTAFGLVQPNVGHQITMNLRFPGQYFDEEAKTHYNYMRSYNPTTGRYLQWDPIGLSGGMNSYAYVRSNPFRYYDPYGLSYMDGDWSAWDNFIANNAAVDWITSDGVVNAIAGFGDSLSLGATKWGRDNWNIGSVDYCSTTYKGGEIAGILWGLGIGGAGAIKAVGTGIKGTTTVTRWGRPGLRPGDWVMQGGKTRGNYFNSFKWERSPSNQSAKFSSGETFTNIPSNSLRYPSGWEKFKGFMFGQKTYNPGAAGLPAWIIDAAKYGAYGSAQSYRAVTKECECQ